MSFEEITKEIAAFIISIVTVMIIINFIPIMIGR